MTQRGRGFPFLLAATVCALSQFQAACSSNSSSSKVGEIPNGSPRPTASASAPSLPPLMDAIRSSVLEDRILWEAYAVGVKGTKPKPSATVIGDIRNWLEKNRGEKKGQIGQMQPAEYDAVTQYQTGLAAFFHGMEFVGYEKGRFLYLDGSIPVRFAAKNGQPVVLITGLASQDVYNTLRLSSKARAAKVISASILTSLKHFASGFGGTNVRYFGIVAAYGSRNPTEDEVISLKSEALAFVVDSDVCHQFLQGNISQEALVKKSDVYLSDRSTVADVRKVEVTLE